MPTEVLPNLQVQLLPGAAEPESQTSELEIVHTTAEYAPPTPIEQQRREDFYTCGMNELLRESA